MRYGNWALSCSALFKLLALVLLISAVSHASYAQTERKKKDEPEKLPGEFAFISADDRWSWEVGIGTGASKPTVNLATGNTANRVRGKAWASAVRVQGFVRLAPAVRFSFGLESIAATELIIAGNGANSQFITAGILLGRVDRPGQFTAQVAAGLGYVSVPDRIDSNNDEVGAKGDGLAYRISVGRTLFEPVRLDLSYIAVNVDDDEANFPSAGIRGTVIQVIAHFR